jgi:hypothetical protein
MNKFHPAASLDGEWARPEGEDSRGSGLTTFTGGSGGVCPSFSPARLWRVARQCLPVIERCVAGSWHLVEMGDLVEMLEAFEAAPRRAA